MPDALDYKKLHAYMLQKTQAYYHRPPEILVRAVQERFRQEGRELSAAEAEKLVTPIEIQRLVKKEMQEKWPRLMAAIPENPLPREKK